MFRIYKLKRKNLLTEVRSKLIITPSNMEDYGKSEHVIKVCKLLKRAAESKESGKILTKYNITDIRNYLMVMVAISNAARSSNLMNMTLHDFSNSFVDEDYPEAKVSLF